MARKSPLFDLFTATKRWYKNYSGVLHAAYCNAPLRKAAVDETMVMDPETEEETT